MMKKRVFLTVVAMAAALLAVETVSRRLWPAYALEAVQVEQEHWKPSARRFLPSDALGWERHPASDDRIRPGGFRSRHIRFSDNPFRVLFIGDSLADALTSSYFGPEAEAALSARAGRPVQIWDFSVAGYDMEHYRRILEVKCRDFVPNALVTIFCLNDAQSFHIPVVFRKGESLYVLEGVALREGHRIRSRLFHWSHLYRILFLNRHWRERSLVENPSDALRFGETVNFIRDWARERGVRPFFVVFPLFKPWEDYTSRENQALRTTVQAVTESGVPSLLLWDKFPAEFWVRFRNAERPDDAIHPNAEGYRRAEQEIMKFLLENWARTEI
jgi:hypothetical protein